MQPKVRISVTRIFRRKLLPPSLPVSRGSVPHYRQWWSKGKEWQLGTGLISEPTSKLLFFIYSKNKGYNLSKKVKRKTKTTPDSPPLYFSFFRVGVLCRDFALEPISFPKVLSLGFLHSGLKAFGV